MLLEIWPYVHFQLEIFTLVSWQNKIFSRGFVSILSDVRYSGKSKKEKKNPNLIIIEY